MGFIAKLPLFLDWNYLELHKLFYTFSKRHYNYGQHVFKEGDPISLVYIII